MLATCHRSRLPNISGCTLRIRCNKVKGEACDEQTYEVSRETWQMLQT